MTTTAELLAMAEAEQSEFAELAQQLTTDEWAAPSLCEGLSVRDVIVHVAAHIHHQPSLADTARLARRARTLPRLEQAMDALLAERNAHRPVAELTEWLASPMAIGGPASASGGLPGLPRLRRRFPDSRVVHKAVAGDALLQLSEMMIHQQDVRRVLGRLRPIPEARIREVLDFTLSRYGSLIVNLARRNARALRLVATDGMWTWGQGPEILGPFEALLMAINGRGVALGDLTGPGLPILAQRVGDWSAKFVTT